MFINDDKTVFFKLGTSLKIVYFARRVFLSSTFRQLVSLNRIPTLILLATLFYTKNNFLIKPVTVEMLSSVECKNRLDFHCS